MACPTIGAPAPDFTLEGTEGPFTLSAHRGERVVLLFYPADDTSACREQFCDYRDHEADLAALPAQVVGISGGDLASKHAFRDRHGLTVPLLADPDGVVARAYGMDSRLLGTKRGTVVVDEAGRVAFVHVFRLSLKHKSVAELRAILDRLPTPA